MQKREDRIIVVFLIILRYNPALLIFYFYLNRYLQKVYIE